MRFTSHCPASPLDSFIDNFWHCADAPSHSRERILPSGTIELVINLREDEVRIYDPKRTDVYRRFPGIVVSGPYASAFVIDPSQHASIMGVHFRPGGAFAFLGTAVRHLASNHAGLEEFWGQQAVELRERLCSTRSIQQRFQILETTLKTKLQWVAGTSAVTLALDIFGLMGGGVSVRSVAERLGLSQRRFIQLFSDQVGLTPKFFCRVIRFQRALSTLEQCALPDWPQLALSCGYYDQSHLIHDFQEFAGLSPASYFQLCSKSLLRNHVQIPS